MKVMILMLDVGNLVYGSGIFDINWNLTVSDALVFKTLLSLGRDDVFADKMGVDYQPIELWSHGHPMWIYPDDPSDLMRAYDVDWLYVYEFIPQNVYTLTGKSVELHEVTLFKNENDSVREVTERSTPSIFNRAVHYGVR